MPATPDDLFRKLDEIGVAHATVRHPPLRTVEESRAMRGTLPGGHAKNLFLKNKKDRLYLLVAEEDARVELKPFAKAVGAGNLSFGKPDLLMATLGVVPGAVTPFALLNAPPGAVSVYFDRRLLDADPLNFHPLDNSMTTTVSRDGLLAFLAALGHPYETVDLEALG
ncbi:MAG: YbaK/EbsC family protein [Alphaproteobacteria bacterium]